MLDIFPDDPLNDGVKPGTRYALILTLLCLLLGMTTLQAEIPPLAPEELLEEADIVVVGTVTGASNWPKLKSITSIDTIYKITVEVESVIKGAPELVGEKVSFKAWQTKRRPAGWVGPGGIWHAGEAEKGTVVKIYASGTAEDANVLQPNGLEIQEKAEAEAGAEAPAETAAESQ